MQKSKLGYPFFYRDELTSKIARYNRNKTLIILLLIWALKVKKLPSTYEFTARCLQRQTYSREVTTLSTRLKENERSRKDIYLRS